MSLVGKRTPEFIAKAIVGGKEIQENFSIRDFEGHYILLFFYPLNFTFVCPTELHAFQEKLEAFKKKNCQILGCSVDSHFSHLAWLNKPKEEGGIQGVTYPLISDITKSISRSYQVLKEDEGIAYRGLFLIDKHGIIRHLLVNDLPLGRSVEEAMRMLDALIAFEAHGEVCPANWKEGEKQMTPSSEGIKGYYSNK